MSRVELSAELFPSGVEAAGRGPISLGDGRLLELEDDAWLEPTLRVEKWEGGVVHLALSDLPKHLPQIPTSVTPSSLRYL